MAAKEKEIAGASYIISFYKEIQQLTHNYGNYLNLMLEVENKYGNPPKNIDDEVQNQISYTIQTVRLSIHKSYVMYCSIQPTLEEKDNKKRTELKEAYNQLKKDFVLNRETLENYVVSINAILVKDIIQNLLASSQGLINEVYGE